MGKSKYGFSAKTTYSVMQQLYENYKLVTYPRTDSRHISEDIVSTLPERLKSIALGPYVDLARSILRNKLMITKRFVDSSKVSDHHAIIPTEQPPTLSRLSSEELKIYDLIVRRFLAVLSPAFEYEQTMVKVKVMGEIFSVKGKVVKLKGWRKVYEGHGSGSLEDPSEDIDGDGNAEQTLPEICKGEMLKNLTAKLVLGKTKPPARQREMGIINYSPVFADIVKNFQRLQNEEKLRKETSTNERSVNIYKIKKIVNS